MLNQLARAIKHAPRLFLRANVSTYVVAVEVVDSGLAKHGVVLELSLAERRAVASNDDELGLAGTDSLDGRLVSVTRGQKGPWREKFVQDLMLSQVLLMQNSPEGNLTGLHNKRKARVDGVGGLGLLGGHLCVGFWGLSGCWKKYGAPVLVFYRLLEREKLSARGFSTMLLPRLARAPSEQRKATRLDQDGAGRSGPRARRTFRILLECHGHASSKHMPNLAR